MLQDAQKLEMRINKLNSDLCLFRTNNWMHKHIKSAEAKSQTEIGIRITNIEYVLL
jgi:hypothetical protein